MEIPKRDPVRNLPDDDPDAQRWPRPHGSNAGEERFDPITANADVRYEAQLEIRKKRVDQAIAERTAQEEAKRQEVKAFGEAYREIAQGSIDRARAGADAVVKASAAIVTLYTAILGLAFAADSRPLPAQGVVAPLFLGAGVVLSTAYLALLKAEGGDEVAVAPQQTQAEQMAVFGGALAELTSGIALKHAALLRASVLSLGVGLACLPLAFLDIGTHPASEPASVEQMDWPDPAGARADDLELRKLLYQAQLSEYTKRLENEGAGSGGWDGVATGLVVLAGVGLVAGGTIALRDTRQRAPAQRQGGKVPPTP